MLCLLILVLPSRREGSVERGLTSAWIGASPFELRAYFFITISTEDERVADHARDNRRGNSTLHKSAQLFCLMVVDQVGRDMELNFTSVSLTLLLIWIVRKSYCFYKCYTAALRSGYPVYISPVGFSPVVPRMLNLASASRKALGG
jgi:hypothetical protein